MINFNPFTTLTDEALHDSLKALSQQERESSVDIILHLMVIKERKLYATMGYSGVFDYCTKALGFSRSTAYRRKTVMDRADEFPELLTRLRDGRLQLCVAACIAPHLTVENATELLDSVAKMSLREVESMLLKRLKAAATLTSEPISLQSSPVLSLSAGTTTTAKIIALNPTLPTPSLFETPCPTSPLSTAPRDAGYPAVAACTRNFKLT